MNVTFSVEPAVLASFDSWWKSQGFKSRSEALAYLMKAHS